MKLCKDCKHFKRKFLQPLHSGRCTVFAKLNLVDGEMTERIEYCVLMRRKWGTCGPDGKLWEAKS